jgi:hypothetical protein
MDGHLSKPIRPHELDMTLLGGLTQLGYALGLVRYTQPAIEEGKFRESALQRPSAKQTGLRPFTPDKSTGEGPDRAREGDPGVPGQHIYRSHRWFGEYVARRQSLVRVAGLSSDRFDHQMNSDPEIWTHVSLRWVSPACLNQTGPLVIARDFGFFNVRSLHVRIPSSHQR